MNLKLCASLESPPRRSGVSGAQRRGEGGTADLKEGVFESVT